MRRRDRRAARPPEQACDALGCSLGVAGERAASRAGALAERHELGEDGVGRAGLVGGPRLRVLHPGDRVDNGVEEHRSHPGREQVGVGLTDKGAVGKAEVGEGPVPDELAQAVEVTGGVLGGDVVQQLPAHLAAPAGQLGGSACVGTRLGHGRRNVHAPPEPRLGRLAGEAAHRVAPVRSPRVPAHDIEPAAASSVEVRTLIPHQLDAAFARAAGVDEHRADQVFLIAAQAADDRQLDLLAARPVPVQRHRNPGALQPLTELLITALPGDPVLPARRSSRHSGSGDPGGRTRTPPTVAAVRTSRGVSGRR